MHLVKGRGLKLLLVINFCSFSLWGEELQNNLSCQEAQERCLQILTELSQKAGIACPRTLVLPIPVLNACAIGVPNCSLVVVTRKLVTEFNGKELTSILGHELGHIKHLDIPKRLITIFLATKVLAVLKDVVFLPAYETNTEKDLISVYNRFFIRLSSFLQLPTKGRIYGSLLNKFFDPSATYIAESLRFLLLGWLVSVWYGRFNKKQEFAADKFSAELTGDSSSLAAALEKLKHERPGYELFADLPVLNHIAPLIWLYEEAEVFVRNTLHKIPLLRDVSALTSSHPATDERIKRLKSLKLA